jgi:hypothetical protein
MHLDSDNILELQDVANVKFFPGTLLPAACSVEIVYLFAVSQAVWAIWRYAGSA